VISKCRDGQMILCSSLEHFAILPSAPTPIPAPTGTNADTGSRWRSVPLWVWLTLVLLAVLFFAAVRYRLRDMPLERDEGEYAYAGQLMLEGIPPYSLAYNMKLPGIYAAYAAIMAVFGQTPAGIHLGLLIVNAATTVLLFFLALQLLGRLAAAITASSYALLSTSASVMGFEAHATNFVILPALIGIWLMLCALRSERSWQFFLSGLFSGIAFLMKQHGIFFVLFCSIYLVWDRWSAKRFERPVRDLAWFLGAAILPYLMTCWLMYRAGVFPQFWFWTFEYAGEYSKMGLRRAIRALLENSRIVIGPAWPVWILAGIGLTTLWWNPVARRHRRFLLLLFTCSFLSLCPGAYFRPHYFILFLPIIALLAGIAVNSCAERQPSTRGVKYRTLIPCFVFLGCFAFSILLQRQTYFELAPDAVVREIYGDNAFVPAVKVAAYIRQHSAENARIAVLGSEPEIYFYAHRHSATGYLYMYSLIVHHKYTALMRRQMMQELAANQPAYVVYVDVWDDWGGPEGGPELQEFLPQLHAFMDRSYEVVGLADIGAETPYVWGADAQNYRPSSSKVIYVLKRKESD